MLRLLPAVAALLVVISLLGLAVTLDNADAAKPDPWHTAPTPEFEWGVVKSFVAGVVPAGGCGDALDVQLVPGLRMPAAYQANGSAVDRDVPAGAPVDGYHIGAPVNGVWVPGFTCTIRLKPGSPMELCDRYAHERYHDLGYKHGDDIPSMNEGGREPACHASPMIISLERYHEAFADVGPRVRCRARTDIVECQLAQRIRLTLNFRGVTL